MDANSVFTEEMAAGGKWMCVGRRGRENAFGEAERFPEPYETSSLMDAFKQQVMIKCSLCLAKSSNQGGKKE